MKKQPGTKRKIARPPRSSTSGGAQAGAIGDRANSNLEVRGRRIIVDLPAGVGRKLRGRNGAKLSVQFADGLLIVERQPNGHRRRRT